MSSLNKDIRQDLQDKQELIMRLRRILPTLLKILLILLICPFVPVDEAQARAAMPSHQGW